MLTLFIFSKNRACQLDLLLRSIKKSLIDVDVHYKIMTFCKATSNSFAKGYANLWKENKDVSHYIEMENFREETIFLLNEIRSPYTMMLVDDDVFIREFNELGNALSELGCNGLINGPEAAIAPRFAPQINYWFEKNEYVDVPFLMPRPHPEILLRTFHQDKSFIGGWNSWYSLDGNIFRTKELRELVISLNFKSPNTLESIMRHHPMPGKNSFLCLKTPVIVGVPMNRVQTDWPTKHEGMSAERLNEMWLAGERLPLTNFWHIENQSTHVSYLDYVKD